MVRAQLLYFTTNKSSHLYFHNLVPSQTVFAGREVKCCYATSSSVVQQQLVCFLCMSHAFFSSCLALCFLVGGEMVLIMPELIITIFEGMEIVLQMQILTPTRNSCKLNKL